MLQKRADIDRVARESPWLLVFPIFIFNSLCYLGATLIAVLYILEDAFAFVLFLLAWLGPAWL